MKKTRLPLLMRQRGYTQEMVAEALGLTKQAVNLTLSSPNPRLESIERIARVIGVPMYAVFVDPDKVASSEGPAVPLACPHCGTQLDVVLPIQVKQGKEKTPSVPLKEG